MPETFRITRDNYWLGIILLVVFLPALPALLVFGVNDAVPDHRVYAALFFIAAWGFFMMLPLWLLSASWRMRIVLSDTDLEVRGILRTVQVRFADIKEINWNSFGGVMLTTATERVRFGLKDWYGHDVCVRIAHAIQLRCPQAEQKHWDLLCLRISPNKPKPSNAPLAKDEIRLTRRLWAKYFLWSAAVFFLLGCVGWHYLGKPHSLAAPLVLLPLWGMLHLMTPKEGIVCRGQSREESAFHWFQLAVFTVFFGGLMAIKQATTHWNEGRQFAVLLPFVAVGIAIWLWKFIPFAKQQKKQWTLQREESLAQWEAFLRPSKSIEPSSTEESRDASDHHP